MSITNNIIYVIGIDQGFLLMDVYDSIEEAIEDIESPDKCHTAFKYATKGHTVRVYKTTMCELHRFYKEFAIHEIPDPKRYFNVYLTQVYPDPFKGYTINELADEGLKLCSDGHCDNDSIRMILKRISELSKSMET